MKINKDYIIPFLGIIFFGSIGIFFFQQCQELKKNPAYTKAVIYDAFIGARGRDYVRFRYVVNGQIYESSTQYNRDKDFFNLGDSCEIVYAKTNPENRKVLENEDKTLKIIRPKKIIQSPFKRIKSNNLDSIK